MIAASRDGDGLGNCGGANVRFRGDCVEKLGVALGLGLGL
jgi:hypothetical protein